MAVISIIFTYQAKDSYGYSYSSLSKKIYKVKTKCLHDARNSS